MYVNNFTGYAHNSPKINAVGAPTAFFLKIVCLFSVFAAAAFAIAIVFNIGFNDGENLAAGRAFKLVDFFDIAFVDINGFAASRAFKLQAFAAIAAIAIVVAIIAIAIIVVIAIAIAVAIAITVAIVIVAAVEIFFYSAEIFIDFFDIFAKSSVFVLKILNGKREILKQISHNCQKLAFALRGIDFHTFHKTLDVCSLFGYVHSITPF
jgi:hypothetical protein